MDLKTEIGRRIKAYRQHYNLTLKDIESRVDVSATHISEIERGKTSPTIGALSKIARALRVDPALFLDHEDLPDAVVTRVDERRRFVAHDEGFALSSLSGGVEHPELSVMMMEWDVGSRPRPHRAHEGEEFALIVSGRLEIRVRDRVHTLNPGESIHFKCYSPHLVTNPGPGPCRAIWATYPRFGF